jgi:uncharacterized protein (DUF2141 family)
MFKKAMFFLASFLLASSFTYAEEKFTISGEVTFQYDGNIYICLLTMEGFRAFNLPGHELSQSAYKVVQMNADLKKAGKVSFTFDNKPKGTYCVFTYQDVNMNGKVDFENYRMTEPWGSYKEGAIGLSPTWQKLKFDLQKDIAGIEIEM